MAQANGDVVTEAVMAALGRPTGEARGLPNAAFTTEEFLETERRTVFAGGWSFAGIAGDVPNPGDVRPTTIAGRPYFLARAEDGAIRVFHNVCPHRGARLVMEPNRVGKVLTCPYHAWSFDLMGRLRARPHFHGPEQHEAEGAAGADRPCLFEARSHTWHDWVFANPDGRAPAFADYLAPALEYLGGYDLAHFRCAHHESYAFDCNWKLAVENYCDFYHVFKVHPELNASMAKDSRRAMTVAGPHLLNGFDFAMADPDVAGAASEAAFPTIPGLGDNLARQMRYAVLFPNIAVNVYPNSAQFVLFDPVAPDATVMHMWFYFVGDSAHNPAYAEARDKHYAQWARLNGEDEGICRRIQEGRASEAYDGGRLAPYWDAGTVHFHRQIAEAVRGEGAFARLD